jgi:hypothetical protein
LGLWIVLCLFALVPLTYQDSPHERNRLKEPVAETACLAALVVALLSYRPKYSADVEIGNPGPFRWAAAGVLWGAIVSTPLSPFPWPAPGTLLPIAFFSLGAFALSKLLRSPRAVSQAASVFGLGYLIAAGIYIACRLGMEGSVEPGWNRPFGNPNLAAGALLGPTLCATVLVIGSFARRESNSRKEMIARLLVPAGGAVLILAGSAGAWIGFLLGLFLSILIYSKMSPKRLGILGVSSISLISIGFLARHVLIPETLINGLETSFAERWIIWKGTWKSICWSPLSLIVGHGPGSFLVIFPRLAGPEVHAGPHPSPITELAHNLYLHVWSEVGIVGLSLLGILIFAGISSARKAVQLAEKGKHRDLMIGLTVGVAGTLIHAAVSVAPHYPSVATNLWFALALLVAGSRTQPHPDRGPRLPPPQRHLARALRGAVLTLAVLAWVLIVLPRFRYEISATKGGIAWKRNGNPKTAQLHYNRMLEQIPFDDRVTLLLRTDRAESIQKSQGISIAQEALEEIHHLAPQFGTNEMRLALGALRMGDRAQAARFLDDMNRTNPYQWQTYLTWIDAEFPPHFPKRTQRIEKRLIQGIRRHPDRFDLLAIRGLWLHAIGHPEPAKKFLQRAMKTLDETETNRWHEKAFAPLLQRAQKRIAPQSAPPR